MVLGGKYYTVDNLYSLPECVNGPSVTSKSTDSLFAFFGDLNLLSNFYDCEFEFTGINFHSSEQLIQYMKAIFFDDNEAAEAILNCGTALECKREAKNIRGYNGETWNKCAKEMCEGGIFQKFRQNEKLMKYLLNTGEKRLIEASHDKTWGTGIHLRDDRALYETTWFSQELLGKILEVRSELQSMKGGNENHPITESEMMDTANDSSSQQATVNTT